MTTYYKNQFRNVSIRLQNWDYRKDGAYFITICTGNREQHFGNIIDGKMHLSNIGVLADVFWNEIKNHAKNVKLDAFVVMPDHIHGILILEGNEIETGNLVEPTDSTKNKTVGQKRFQNIGKNSVSSIIGSYKSAVTKHSKRMGYQFSWQTRFYEHIIRDEPSLNRIRDYIIENPKKWNSKKD